MRRLAHITLTALLLACTLLAQAQPRRHEHGSFNPEEFKARLECYITREVGFSAAEASQFYPLYHEMKEKQRSIQRKIFRLKKDQCQKNDDKDFAPIIQEITKLNIEKAKLEDAYYRKMCKVVPAKKVYNAMLAEDKFHRDMIMEHKR